MKTGSYQIQNIIFEQLKASGFQGGISFKKFAKDTAKQICDTLEENGDMDNFWNEAHGFPSELEETVRTLERGLGLNLLRQEKFIEVYQWIKEQDADGKPISKFIEWATDKERASFISKYRFNPGLIKIDYQFSFEDKSGYNPQNLDVGF